MEEQEHAPILPGYYWTGAFHPGNMLLMAIPNSSSEWDEATVCTAFDGDRQVATGSLRAVAAKAKKVLDRRGERASVLIFDDATARPIEVDFRGSVRAVVSRLPKAVLPHAEAEPQEPRGPGRPKLGVVAREVTLLPRHWEWLSAQPGGASVALRKLVDAARRTSADADRKRLAQESAYRFMSAMAGDRPGFEEAARALFAGNTGGFEAQTANWPPDVRGYAWRLAQEAMRH